MRSLVFGIAIGFITILVLDTGVAKATVDATTVDGTITNKETSGERQSRESPQTAGHRDLGSRGSKKSATSGRDNGHGSSKSRSNNSKSPAQLARQREAEIQSAVKSYQNQAERFDICMVSMGDNADKCRGAVAPEFGDAPLIATYLPQPGQDKANPAAPQPITLTAEQVAYMAFVKIKLTAPKPGIGPPPSINQWNMAAVGYPLWLWGEGAVDPPLVTDSIGGLYVSLDAEISKMVFSMGDGTKVTCQGPGQKWTRSVPAGANSPTCGHVYETPSLPKGEYTVTATTYWSVAWNANGETGVIPFVQSASTAVPVGELQVLVR